MADWTDLQAYYATGESLGTLVSDSGLDSKLHAWVTRSGDSSYSSSRDYFVSYHNHVKPSGYLAHDQLDNHFLSLGSWYSNYYVLCYQVKPDVSEETKKFATSTDQVAYGSNYNQVCRQEFGNNWRMADWTDLQAYYTAGESLDGLVSHSGLDSKLHAWVTRSGDSSYSSSRDYFVSYHNHVKPSGYLAHDQLDNHFLSLGSWYSNYYVLCYQEKPEVSEETQKFATSADPVAYASDYNQVCRAEFGNNWRLADWTDLQAYYAAGESLVDLVSHSDLDSKLHAWVTRSGDSSYSSSRDYFASYHNRSKPSGYLAHDQIDSHFLSLGSWYSNYYVLCYQYEAYGEINNYDRRAIIPLIFDLLGVDATN